MLIQANYNYFCINIFTGKFTTFVVLFIPPEKRRSIYEENFYTKY